jgi:hypothetical protein
MQPTSAQGQASIRKGFVSGEFLTRTYRMSGEAELRGIPLLDQLNDLNAQFVTLERLYISPLLDPAVLTGNYPVGEIRKENLGIIVLTQLKDGLPQREGRYMGRDHADKSLLIVVAGFEVRGVIRLHPSVNAANFIRTTPEMYIPIFNATATVTARREIVFKGGAVLVNRSRIEVFCITES